jgi:hypothetical protein
MTPSSTLPSRPALQGAAAHLADELRAGHVYRREDLMQLSTAVDRHLRELVAAGKLQKLAQGLYHAPRRSRFGPLPPSDEQVVRGFLRDHEFLVFSPSSYNTVGLGTTCSSRARSKLATFEPARIQRAVDTYGNMATRKRVREWTCG